MGLGHDALQALNTLRQAPISLTHVILGAGAAYALYCLGWTVYVFYLHPLARYPGPKLWLVTRWPAASTLRNGTFNASQLALHDRYGHVVRYSPDELSFTHPQAWRDIQGFRKPGEADRNFERDPRWYQPAPNGAYSLLVARNDAHGRIRRLVAPAFTDRALKLQEKLLVSYVDLLVAKLAAKGADKPVNMAHYFQYLTFDIIGDLMYGESFGCLERDDFHPWLKLRLAHFQRLLVGGSLLIMFPFLRPILPYLIPKRVQAEAQERWQFTVDMVAKRLDPELNDEKSSGSNHGNGKQQQEEEVVRPDFMAHILAANEKSEARSAVSMARGEIEATFDVLATAGSETSATALTAVLHYLLRNPDKLAKLQREVRGTFSSSASVTSAAAANLPYLNAVLNEGMRLCPPAPTMRPRVVPKGGAVICGQYVPEGTRVGVTYYATFRSAKNFARPHDFVPERWLDPSQGGVRLEPHETAAFQPFSYGPRDCLGKGLAWSEMRLALAKLVWHFDFENRSPEARWETQKTFIMWDMEPQMTIMRPVVR